MNKAEWIKGKSVDDILNMSLKELNKMSESQLKTIVGRLVSAGNKRLRRYQEKKGKLPTGAKEKTYDEMKFSTVGKDKSDLMEEFKRAKTFLQGETSSLTGAKKVERNVRKELKKYGVDLSDLTEEQYDDFWEIYKKLREKNKKIAYNRELKYNVFDNIKSIMGDAEDLDIDEIVAQMDSELSKIYEAEKALGDNGTSRFYEV